jgi:4'-phosphopantetheinyl transferase
MSHVSADAADAEAKAAMAADETMYLKRCISYPSNPSRIGHFRQTPAGKQHFRRMLWHVAVKIPLASDFKCCLCLSSGKKHIQWYMKRNKEAKGQLSTEESQEAVSVAQAISWLSDEEDGLSIACLVGDGQFDHDKLLSAISEEEALAARSLAVAAEKRHFVLRRTFQRAFVAKLVQWTGPLSRLPLVHRRDERTVCSMAPALALSFSSSQNCYCACASRTQTVGIDIEINRHVKDLEALAERFFTPEEAQALATVPAETRDEVFLKFWTAKEAGLKSLGHGIVTGLNTFTLERQAHSIRISGPDGPIPKSVWKLRYLSGFDNCTIAVVHSHPQA